MLQACSLFSRAVQANLYKWSKTRLFLVSSQARAHLSERTKDDEGPRETKEMLSRSEAKGSWGTKADRGEQWVRRNILDSDLDLCHSSPRLWIALFYRLLQRIFIKQRSSLKIYSLLAMRVTDRKTKRPGWLKQPQQVGNTLLFIYTA